MSGRRACGAGLLLALGLGACTVDYGTLAGTGPSDGRSDSRDGGADVPRDQPAAIDAGPDGGNDTPVVDAPAEIVSPVDAGSDAADAGPPFAFRKPITIPRAKVGDPATASLASYPLLIALDDPDLRSAASGGKVQSAEGADIAFVATTSATCGGPPPCTLAHEFERYLPATGSLIAWVRVPVLNGPTAPSDTVIHMYYGSAAPPGAPAAASVWDPGFAGVWHLGEGQGELAEVVDSTANANAGAAVGAIIAGAPGPIGTAFELDGSGGHVAVPDSASLDLGDRGAVSLWYRTDTPAVWRALLSKGPLTNGAGESVNYAVELNLTDQLAFYLGNGTRDFSTYTGPHPHTTDFHQVAMVWEQGMLYRYLDGAPLGAPLPLPITPGPNDIPLRFGSYSSELKDPLDGALDEIRVSRVARAAAWIATEFQNQSAPSGFVVVGAEEAAASLR